MRNTRRSLSCTLILFAIGVFSSALAQSRPNIILILSDDLGYNDLSSYGSTEIRTPNIDSLARDGVRLRNAYSNAPVCTPTRVALMTGRYQQRSGFEWVIDYDERERGLPASEPGLPRFLKNQGYVTGAFGKWHLGYKPEFGPNAHGFDEFFGFLAPDLDYYAHTEALGQPGLYENTDLVQKPGYLTDLITERAVSFIERHKSQPFFLYVPFNAPHWPFQAPDRSDDVRGEKTYGPRNGNRADYIEMVRRMDTGVGRILRALDATGVAGNTLVVFTNDNGGERFSDNRPFFHGKYTLWEGGLRVPCLMRWPGKIAPSTVSDQMLITMDITAMLLGVGGVPPSLLPKLDGEDLLPVMLGKEKPHERTFFWSMAAAQGGQKAARRGRWKYVRERVELLFDLDADPAERINLAYRNPKVVAELREAVDQWVKETKASVSR
jgi:arylsulfatase A-like enzyme